MHSWLAARVSDIQEIRLPVPYDADRDRAEAILMAAAESHAVTVEDLSAAALHELQRRYVMRAPEMGPRVYYRLTDNWLELAVRFLVEDHGIRDVKDAMSREILRELERAGIRIASATFEVVGLPRIQPQAGADSRDHESITDGGG